jgi:hypothetical protein
VIGGQNHSHRYMFIGIRLDERDLITLDGDAYIEYRKCVFVDLSDDAEKQN